MLLEEENPSKGQNDIMSDTWTEHFLIVQETILFKWNIIIILSLKEVFLDL